MPDEVKKVSVKINGREYTVPASWSVIQACHNNGIEVPHYCYHPDLSVAGNCRMCLVKVSGLPRPVIACATPVSDKLEIDTTGEEVVNARKAIMEFLLINHPLDCPECDQAGECRLQNYSYDYGRDHGRFHEEKVVRTKSSLGPHVKYWGSRCIVCTRCVRFTNEVSGTEELAVINRGDRSEISVFPGRVLDNPLSLNTVDVCPVGALVSADFLYSSRVWYLKSAPSICSDCSVGCNTRVDVDRSNAIKRIMPRRNDLVNKEWMCDHGRLSFPYVYENRLSLPRMNGSETSWKEALQYSVDLLKSSIHVTFLVSAWTTNDAIQKAKGIAYKKPPAALTGFANPIGENEQFPGFLISGDKNPNRMGFAELTEIADIEKHLKETAADSNPIELLVVISNIPEYNVSEDVKKLMDRAQKIIVLDFAEGPLTNHKNTVLVLPTLTHFEKSGSFNNGTGLLQTFSPVIEPVGYGRNEIEILDSWIESLRKDGVPA